MKPAAKKTTKKGVTKKAKPAMRGKAKAPPKAAQFGFGGPSNPFGPSVKKGGKPTNFANAMQSMSNLISDLEIVDTKGPSDILNDPNKKETLLNCITNNDYEKFEMLLGMFNKSDEEESKEDVNKLCREVRTSLNESLLHLAVVHYVEKTDSRYMSCLCNIAFPLYEEDQNCDIPVFALSLCATDNDFITGLDILIQAGLDVNHTNSSGKDLLEFLSEFSISPEKVEFMKKHRLKSSNIEAVKNNIKENSDLSETQREEILAIL
mmetsp:Transcript_3468/g.2933  ORF Transcript_3468/g.2933 Transcript_3468/m.2933 type:complete len:264 (+) Transcript_3468:32-823(+)